MSEQVRSPRESLGPGAAGPDGLFGDGAGTVTCSHGPYCEQLPAANMTVKAIRSRYRDRFDIDPRSTPVLDGDEAAEDTVVHAGQMLMFVRRAGEKGSAAAPPGRWAAWRP